MMNLRYVVLAVLGVIAVNLALLYLAVRVVRSAWGVSIKAKIT